MFLQNSMDDIRSDWLVRLDWYEQLPDRLNFYCQDCQLIRPLTVNHYDQETLLSSYYGYHDDRQCDESLSSNLFDSLFYQEPLIWTNKEDRLYGFGIVNSLTAVDIQYCFDQYFQRQQENSIVRNCESIPLRNTDPFMVLDAGTLVVSTQNIQNLLGSVIQVGKVLYQISSYTVHRDSHFYSVMYLPQNNRNIIFDNNHGFLQNHLSVYKLHQLYSYYNRCRDVCSINYPDETISLIILVKINRN
ncbi:uncharacterized protein [Mytilus edulis]|uniref:uncharacterized protein n=1 Tax=Mytilus edulis TaxID=6550 RepID=UPI0039F08A58